VEINFRWYPYKPPFDPTEKRLALRKLLNTIPDVHLPVECVTEVASIALNVLLTEPALRAFLDALEWALAEIRLSFYAQTGFPLPPLGTEVYPPSGLSAAIAGFQSGAPLPAPASPALAKATK
jgi:hypothetical protein